MSRGAARLVAILPLPPDEYEADFSDGDSVAEFRRLLEAASVVVTPAPTGDDGDGNDGNDGNGGRPAAYERAGRAIVDGSDLLVALWDGGSSRGRGGTA